MYVRKVGFKDWVFEPNGNLPSRWKTNNTTDWSVTSSTIRYNNTGAAGDAVAPAERSTLLETGAGIAQSAPAAYDFRISPQDVTTGWYAGVAVMADATTGAYFGDSYFIRIDATTTQLWRSDADTTTALSTANITHTTSSVYTFIVNIDTGGDITVNEDGSDVLSSNDTTHTTGKFLALKANKCDVQYSKIRARRGGTGEQYITDMHVTHELTKGISVLEFGVGRKWDDTVDWDIGDGVEVIVQDQDGNFDVVDFWGKVEKIENDSGETPLRVTAYDWRVELMKAEGVVDNPTITLSNAMGTLVTSKCRVLTEGSIKSTGAGTSTRDVKGETAFEAMRKFCEEAGYFSRYTGDGEFIVSDTYTNRTDAIPGTAVLKYKKVDDLVLETNSPKVYYSGGSTSSGGSGANYETYGRSEKIVVNLQLPSSTEGDAVASYQTQRYGGKVSVIDVWVSYTYSDYNVGETVTISIPYLNVTNATALIIEKEYGTETVGVRYRVQTDSKERHLKDFSNVLGDISNSAKWALGQQV
jgi:hypothetical protein